MHPVDVLHYGHQTVIEAVGNLEESAWDIPGACGVWSCREIIAHLASFELVFVDLLHKLLNEDVPTPAMNAFMTDGPANFNDNQVALRKDQSPGESWAEYETAFQKSHNLFKRIPAEMFRQSGILAFYGDEYDLEDFITYTFYGHKREHAAQINAFIDVLKERNQ